MPLFRPKHVDEIPAIVGFAFAIVGHFCVCRLRVGDIECSESCEYSKDGYCDDGGSGSDYDACAFGTDCEVRLPSKNMTFEKRLWCCA